MPEDKAREFRVIDNRTNEFSQWENDKLALELREFVDQKYAQQMFPEIKDNVKIQDKTDYDITDEDISETEARLDDAFKDKSEERNDGFLNIPCNHCGHKFGMKVKDLVHKFHYTKEDRELEND